MIAIYGIKRVDLNSKKPIRFYIGQALNVKRRIRDHKMRLEQNRHHNIKLQNSWNKRNGIGFEFIIIEEILDSTPSFITSREQYWIDFYDAVNIGFNICPIAGSCAGIHISEEHKAKISKANKGKPCKQETREKIRKTLLGIGPSKIACEKISKTMKGRKRTKEHQDKLNKSQKGRKGSNLGKKFSESTKTKMRESTSASYENLRDKTICIFEKLKTAGEIILSKNDLRLDNSCNQRNFKNDNKVYTIVSCNDNKKLAVDDLVLFRTQNFLTISCIVEIADDNLLRLQGQKRLVKRDSVCGIVTVINDK